jgi:hypothetical protein
MTTAALSPKTFKDAGLLRQYVAANYGSVLTYGSTSTTVYFRGVRLVKLLARLAGVTFEQAMTDIQADYFAIEGN